MSDNTKYYMITMIGTKRISPGIIQQVLWHNAYTCIEGVHTKESLLGQSLMDFSQAHPGFKMTDYLIDKIELDTLD